MENQDRKMYLPPEEARQRKRRGWMLIAVGGALSVYYISVLIRASFNWGLAIPLLGVLGIAFVGYIKVKYPTRE